MGNDDGFAPRGISRRELARMGFAAGAFTAATGAGVALPGLTSYAAADPVALQPSSLGAVNSALTYVGVDAFGFTADDSSYTRTYSDTAGASVGTSNKRLSAAVPIPGGSTIYQLNIAYRGQPIIEIWPRALAAPTPYSPLFQQTVPASAAAATVTYQLPSPITVAPLETLALRAFLLSGDSIFGMVLGYTPPTQSFIPFVGSPRVLDTRAGSGKLTPNEERVIPLGMIGARSAVVNVTVTDTEGPGGYVAVFRADVGWPGNSSVNWSGPNQSTANGVITAMDASGQIRIRGGDNRTNVVIDRIGWLI